MKRFKLPAGVAVAAVAALFAVAGSAQAGSDYSHAQYQITFSLNCDNPSAPCQNRTSSRWEALGAGSRFFQTSRAMRR
jgi:hypothetical protein